MLTMKMQTQRMYAWIQNKVGNPFKAERVTNNSLEAYSCNACLETWTMQHVLKTCGIKGKDIGLHGRLHHGSTTYFSCPW